MAKTIRQNRTADRQAKRAMKRREMRPTRYRPSARPTILHARRAS